MTLTNDAVLEALRPVQDPEILMSIVDLGMVKGIDIDGGAVKVTVALTIAGCPLRTEITNRVNAAVRPLDGVTNVDVELTVMTDEERSALSARLRGTGGAHENAGSTPQGHAHGPSVTMPFMEPESRTRVLLMSSGKGGVGKSSVSVNVAVALAQQGLRVGILDADIYGFSVPKMMNITQEPTVIDSMIVPPVAFGVSVVSAGYFVPEDQALVWRGPMLTNSWNNSSPTFIGANQIFLSSTCLQARETFSISIAQYLPRAEVLIVTTPNPAAQRVAQRMAALAEKVNLRVTGVIENMSWFTGDDAKRYELFGSGGGAELATKLGVPFIAQVPFVSDVREGGDIGLPIT